MNFRNQLNRLSDGLTARERAILVLRSMKDKTNEDTAWRRMPNEQVREFNRYIAMMNACNMEFAFLITFVEQDIEKLGLRLGWLLSLRMWELNLAEIDFAAALVARETITESEYRARVEASANTYAPVRDLAVLVCEDRRAWKDEDVEPVAWTREEIVTEKAWSRLVDEAEAELRQMAASGVLEGRGRGAGLKIRRGSFDAWIGHHASVFPEYANVYDVQPDERWPHVEADRRTLKYLQQAIHETPLQRGVAVDGEVLTVSGLVEQLATTMRQGLQIRWADIVAIDTVLAEVAAEFNGEDPLKPLLRKALEDARESHAEIRRSLEAQGHPVELPEVTDRDIADVRRLVEKNL
jgi:hypothetical protein